MPDAPITVNGTVNVTNNSADLGDFTVSTGGQLNLVSTGELSGTETVTGGGSVDFEGDINVADTSSITTSGDLVIQGAITGTGNLAVSVGGSFHDQGTVSVLGDLTVESNDGGDIQFVEPVSVSGDIDLTTTGSIDLYGTIDAASLDAQGGTITMDSEGRGSDVTDASLSAPDAIDITTFQQFGTLELSGGGTTTIGANGEVWTSTLTVDQEVLDIEGAAMVSSGLVAENGSQIINNGEIWAGGGGDESFAQSGSPSSLLINLTDAIIQGPVGVLTITIPYAGDGVIYGQHVFGPNDLLPLYADASSSAAGAVANWTVMFHTTTSGLSAGDTVTVGFPGWPAGSIPASPQVVLPSPSGFASGCTASASTSGTSVTVTLDDASGQTCSLPAATGASFELLGLTNPAAAGQYTLSVQTSQDQEPANAAAGIVAGSSPSDVTFAGASQTHGVGSAWTVGLSSSGSGALVAGSVITVGFPPGFGVSPNPPVTLGSGSTGCSATAVGSGSAATVTLADADGPGSCTLPASTAATLTLGGLTNPAPGLYLGSMFNVSTSSDSSPGSPAGAVTIAATSPTAVEVSFDDRAAGDSSTVSASFTPSAIGGLGAGSTVTLSLPSGTSVPSSPTVALTGGFVGCTATGAGPGATVVITLAGSGCALPAGTQGSFTVAGVTTPPAGSYPAGAMSLATSADTAAASPASGVTIFGAATQLVFTRQPDAATGGTSFPTQPVVEVEDANGNLVANDDSTIVTLGIGTNPGGGTLSCSSNTVTANGGVVSFSGCAIDKTGSGYTLSTTNTGSLTDATSTAFDITAGPAAALVVSGSSTQAAGTANALTITAVDAGGNTATGYSGDKQLTFSGASSGETVPTVTDKSGNAVVFGDPTTITFTNGVSTAGGSMVLYVAEHASISVSDGTLSSAAFGVTVAPGLATSLSIQATTTSPVAGEADQLTITAYDRYYNIATSYTGDKSLTFTGAPTIGTHAPTVTSKTGAAVAFGTATTVTFTNGVATAGGAMVLYKAAIANVSVTDGALTSNTLAMSVSPGPLAGFLFDLSSPQTSRAPVTGTNTLTAQDAYGNTEVGFDGDSDSVTITANAPLTGTVSGLDGGNVLEPSDFNAGVADLTALGMTYSGNTGTGTFTATSHDGKTGTSGPVTEVHGTPTQLVFTTVPSDSVAHMPMAMQPAVTVEDALGNPITEDNTTQVTLNLSGGSSLSCAQNTVTVTAGVATFSGCTIPDVGSYTVTASATGLSSTTQSVTVYASNYTDEFSYTGSVQTWQVPSGVTSIEVTATGASGQGGYGGFGGYEQAIIPVTPGETLNVYVGGVGSNNVGGYNGGGGDNFGYGSSATGGGASDIRIGGTSLSNRVLVAGGGGGAANCVDYPSLYGMGGSGGGTTGEQGWEGTGGLGISELLGGAGGSQTAGTSGGSLGQGGGGAWCGGDGGGGYYGGAAGQSASCVGCQSGGGGGGSSYAEPSAVDVTSLQGISRGKGQVTINYPAALTGTASAGTQTFAYTGGPQFYTVPAGVTKVTVSAAGAQGDSTEAAGGPGGYEQGGLPVIPGQTLMVVVGGAGSGLNGGYNGGGGNDFGYSDHGGAGGGASDVRTGATLGDRVIVAAAGGGGGNNGYAGAGGGGLVGGGGSTGGTQTAGGHETDGWGDSGKFGIGGGGGYVGGDGGGGWYGGGVGSGGGGGGSSYAISTATNVATVPGIHAGNGVVTIRAGGYGPIPLNLRRGCDVAAPGVCGPDDSDVDPGTGDYNHSTTDASVNTYGPPLAFTRTYDSSLAQEQATLGKPGPLGYGWSDDWNAFLTLQNPADTVTVHEPTGAEVQFLQPVNGACPQGTDGPGTAGTYCAAPYITATLTYSVASQTYTFITHPYERYVFDQNGRLVSEGGPGGATLSVAYNSPLPGNGECPSTSSSCETITSASGRALVIASNSSGLVTQVSDPLDRTWKYGYCVTPSSNCSTDDLVSVTDPAGNVTTYTYDQGNSNPALANDLLTITSPNGQPGGQDAGADLALGYNAAGQVISQTDPDGNLTTSDYSGLDASTGTGVTVVTDPDGNKTEYGYTAGILTSKTEGYGTANPSTWTYETDPSTGLDLSVTDPNDHTTAYTYDADGNTTSVTDPLGNRSTYSFNSFDEQTCATEPMAASGCSSLNPPSAITPGGTVSPPSGAPPAYVTYSAYDTAGNPVWTTAGDYNPAGTLKHSRTTYDLYSGESVTLGSNTDSCAATPPSLSLPCLTINADAVVTQLGYDAAGDVTSSSTPDGNPGGEDATTTYTYDADGEQRTMVAPDGNLSGANPADYTTTSTYTDDGQLSTQTVGGGSTARETVYGYDTDGNQNSIKDPRGYTTTKLYDADDQLTLVTDPDSQQTLTCYDGDGNVSETVPASGVAANSLTPASCPSSYPAGYGDRLAADATTYGYDALGDKTTITSPAPAGQTGYETTTNAYDPAGQLTSTTAPPASNDTGAPNQVTDYTYDAAGELLTTKLVGSGGTPDSITSYCYDPDGEKTATVAPDGNTSGVASCSGTAPYQTTSPYQTGYRFFSLGEQLLMTTPSTSFVTNPTTSHTYDPAGNLQTTTDPAGVRTTYTYTPLNQIQTVSYSDSTHGASYSYDANGNKLSMSDATGDSSYVYDQFNELKSYTNGAGNEVRYDYDPDGDQTAITYPLGAAASWAASDSVTYGYDNADELNSITDFNNTTSTLTNTPDGLPHVLSLGSTGDTITTNYDQTDNPSDITLANGSSTLQKFAYSDSPSGTTAGETDTPSSPQTPVGYDYNALGRVTQMTPGSGTSNYGYDPSGNLTTLPTGATGTYDDASELTSSNQSGTTTNYTYNQDGERTTETVIGSATVSAGYNGAQELTSYSDNAANMTAATYDGDGIRQTATTTPAGGSSSTENFTWDPSGATPQLLMDSNNAYIYGPDDTPFEQVNLSTGTVQYLLADQLGSVRGIIDSTGNLTATTSYDAWGNPETIGGLTTYTPIGYAGYYTDPTGLTYNLARYYDPTTGQFFTVDPKFETTLQAYEYANDNPVNGTDPSGADLGDEEDDPDFGIAASPSNDNPEAELFQEQQREAADPGEYLAPSETPEQALVRADQAVSKTLTEYSRLERLIGKLPPGLYYRALKILNGLAASEFGHGQVYTAPAVEQEVWTSKWTKVAWFGKQLLAAVRQIKGWR